MRKNKEIKKSSQQFFYPKWPASLPRKPPGPKPNIKVELGRAVRRIGPDTKHKSKAFGPKPLTKSDLHTTLR